MANQNKHDTILTPAAIGKADKMKKLLYDEFDSKSQLFQILKDRDELSLVFTDKILSMEENALYSTQEVADLLETETYNVNNKRKEFVEYINPQIIGGPNSRNWKHDFKAVFRLKMIDVLTGKDGAFTLKQVRQILYGHHEVAGDTPPSDLVYETMAKFSKAFEDLSGEEIQKVFQVMVSNEFRDFLSGSNDLKLQRDRLEDLEKKIALLPSSDIDNRISQIEEQLNVAKMERENAIKECLTIFDKIKSSDLTLEEKEKVIERFNGLRKTYSDHLDIIELYQGNAAERILSFRQEKREVELKTLKEYAYELFEKHQNQSLSQEERDKALTQLEEIKTNNPEIRGDILIFIAQAKQERRVQESKREEQPPKKKGFLSRLFG